MSKKNPLKNKKKQHFVPRSYLKRFTIEGEKSLVWAFDKQKLEFNKTPASINKVCTRDYYYYQPDGNGFEHTKVEDVMSKIEKHGNDIIDKIINSVNVKKEYANISEEERGTFAFYMALMLTRGPAFRDGINHEYGQLARNSFNTLYRSGKLTEPPETVKKEIDKKGIDEVIIVKIHPSVSLETMRKCAENIYPSMLLKNWFFVVTSEELEFITSDTPFVFMSSSGKVKYLGPAHPDAKIMFPISKKVALIIDGKKNTDNMPIVKIPLDMVKEINRCIANAANDLILCSKKYDWLKDIITSKTGQKFVSLTADGGYEIIDNPYKKKLSKDSEDKEKL